MATRLPRGPKYQTLHLHNFSRGIRTGIPQRNYDTSETPECWNIDFYPENTIARREGYQYIGGDTVDSSGSPVTKLAQFFVSTGVDYLCAFTAVSASGNIASVYHGDATTWTNQGSGIMGSAWTPIYSDNIVVDTFADRIIATNGTSDAPIYFDTSLSGTGWAILPVSGTSSSYTYYDTYTSNGTAISACVPCAALKGFKNYLFLGNTIEGGTTYSSRIRWSALENPHEWPAENYIDLDPNDGDYITGMEVLSDHLIVFKTKKIYAISYIGGIYLFDSEIRVDGRGCVAPQSISSTYNDLIFFAEDGIYTFNGQEISETSFRIKKLTLDVNPTTKALVQAAPREEKNQIWFVAPSGSTTTNTIAYVYDYVQGGWGLNTLKAASLGWYYNTSDKYMYELDQAWDYYDIAWDDREILSNTTYLLVGGYDGYVSRVGTVNADNGAAISSTYRTPWIDFGDPNRTKRIMRITFFVESLGENASTYGLDWYLRTDWERGQIPVASGVIGLSGMDAGATLEQRVDLTQQARAFQLEFGTDGINEPWKLYEIFIDYTVKGTVAIDSENA